MKQAYSIRECRFRDSVTNEYLGFCVCGGPTAESAELHPIRLPFDLTACTVEKGPFRHQYGRQRS